MSNRAVVSVSTSPETSQRLDTLARLTKRSKSFLANEAIERYLAEEEAFVAAVKEGLADADAGRTVSADTAREKVKARLSGKSQSRSAK